MSVLNAVLTLDCINNKAEFIVPTLFHYLPKFFFFFCKAFPCSDII